MVLLFGTLLRFVIFFINIFFDCCIFDNNVSSLIVVVGIVVSVAGADVELVDGGL